METIQIFKCKYQVFGQTCHYWQEIKLFDDTRLHTYGICSYLGNKCLCDDKEGEKNEVD